MRVLLIEDDSAVAQSIELMLKSESFNVYTTDLGEEGVDLGKLYDYDIILLDLNLPDMSGYDVLKQLRVSKIKTPILILSGLAGIEDKVKGLGVGADDYMTKPFHKDELVARIHAIVRRSKGHAQSVIQTGDLVVNLDTKTVEVGGQRVHLTGKEYQMLELLSLRKGTTLTKEMFLNHLYGGMDEPELKIIDVLHLQAAQEARECFRGAQLHRDRVGPRLRAARAARGRRAHPRLIQGLVASWLAHSSRLTPPQMAGFLFVRAPNYSEALLPAARLFQQGPLRPSHSGTAAAALTSIPPRKDGARGKRGPFRFNSNSTGSSGGRDRDHGRHHRDQRHGDSDSAAACVQHMPAPDRVRTRSRLDAAQGHRRQVRPAAGRVAMSWVSSQIRKRFLTSLSIASTSWVRYTP